MKKRLMVAFVVTAVSAAGWAIWVNACDRDKQTSASTASTAAHEGCAAKAGATTAGMTCAGHGTSATTASMNGGHDGCGGRSMKGATAATASMSGGHDGCAGKSMTGATATNAGVVCDSRFMGAGMIGAPGCANHGTSASTAAMEATCDACAEMLTCSGQLSASGVQTQIVPLKNGVMFVYTTDTAAHVRAVQNAIARRGDHLNTLAQAGDHAKLCPECRAARGAIASGKLTRETVNIEGGCMTLVTSSDPALVSKLRAMAAMSNGKVKS